MIFYFIYLFFRENLDPLSQHEDRDIWRALELSQIKDVVASHPEGLSTYNNTNILTRCLINTLMKNFLKKFGVRFFLSKYRGKSFRVNEKKDFSQTITNFRKQ